MPDLLFVDRRCTCNEPDAYRMIGGCYNCGTSPILGLFSAGHQQGGGECPACGCDRLHWDRLATPDEIPAEATNA